MKTIDKITYKVERIGVIDKGCDGKDEYSLVTSDNDLVTALDVEDEFLSRYYRDSNHAGGYFCHSVSAINKCYSETQFIVIIYHQYDV